MYGSGLRLMEALRLRVKTLTLRHRAILVRDGKGQKDRVVTLADELIVPLRRHLEGVRLIHTKDLADGFGKPDVWTSFPRSVPSFPRDHPLFHRDDPSFPRDDPSSPAVNPFFPREEPSFPCVDLRFGACRQRVHPCGH